MIQGLIDDVKLFVWDVSDPSLAVATLHIGMMAL